MPQLVSQDSDHFKVLTTFGLFNRLLAVNARLLGLLVSLSGPLIKTRQDHSHLTRIRYNSFFFPIYIYCISRSDHTSLRSRLSRSPQSSSLPCSTACSRRSACRKGRCACCWRNRRSRRCCGQTALNLFFKTNENDHDRFDSRAKIRISDKRSNRRLWSSNWHLGIWTRIWN